MGGAGAAGRLEPAELPPLDPPELPELLEPPDVEPPELPDELDPPDQLPEDPPDDVLEPELAGLPDDEAPEPEYRLAFSCC